MPDVTDAELQRQPRALKMLRENMTQLNFNSVNWRTDINRGDLLRLRRHYAANVSMIDAQVGRIMAALDARGYLDNAIVIFTSDHADALGDHGHIQKWTMYNSVLRVPLVFWSKGRIPGGRLREDLVQLIDIAPTILEAAKLQIPLDFEARSLWGALEDRTGYVPRDTVYSEVARDHVQTGAEFIVMRRCRDWKLVIYLDDEEGELYDLHSDPEERDNLWHNPEKRERRDQMVVETLRWSVGGSLKAASPPRSHAAEAHARVVMPLARSPGDREIGRNPARLESVSESSDIPPPQTKSPASLPGFYLNPSNPFRRLRPRPRHRRPRLRHRRPRHRLQQPRRRSWRRGAGSWRAGFRFP